MRRSDDVTRARYRRLLGFFFPRHVRDRDGRFMEEAFVRLLELERSARGARGVAGAWLAAARDGAWNGWVRGYGAAVTRSMRTGWFSVLDLKLAARRLRKHWGLTLIGGLAIATGISIGAVLFGAADLMRGRSLPLDEGGRVVALQLWDVRTQRRLETPVADFERWRTGLRSFVDIGAFRSVTRNLALGDGPPEPATVAEMTASGFELARVAPLVGRHFSEEDEAPGAPPVAVIGEEVWGSRFAHDPDIIGREVRLGGVAHTVVGVMPGDFGFPLFHNYWVPLRADRDDRLPAGGLGAVFARLDGGITFAEARAELAAVGFVEAEVAADREVEPRVLRYAQALSGEGEDVVLMVVMAVLAGLMLIPVCANLAILVYARTVARQEEFAARHALGASRGRIISQIFLEVVLIAALAGAVGLVAVRIVLGLFGRLMEQQGSLPFWFDPTPSPASVVFVASLALMAAAIAGLVPAVQATGRMMRHGLRASGTRSTLTLGRMWTGFVVVQVAFSMAAIPLASDIAWGTLRPGALGPGFPAETYLMALLATDGDSLGATDRAEVFRRELLVRLGEEPEVLAATFVSAVPGSGPFASIQFEPVDGVDPSEPLAGVGARQVQVKRVDERFFDAFGMRPVAGRLLDARDAQPLVRSAVVDETFAVTTFGGRSPLGHRFRYGTPPAEEGAEWYEIVGVVADRPANRGYPMVYHPVVPGETDAPWLALRLASDRSGAVTARVRELAAQVHPGLRVDGAQTLDQLYRQQAVGNNVGALALGAGMLSVLLLSAGGIYSLMSFTVNQRRREIGIRSALGAQPRRLLAGVFGRALRQLGTGAALGAMIAGAVEIVVPEAVVRAVGGWDVPGALPATAVLMILVGIVAAVGPARTGLAVDPTQAIREGG